MNNGDKPLETYVIHVTKECNCDCAYCYEKDKTSTYTWEEIKKVIDDIVKYRTSDAFHIEFLGGEPMMGWKYIKQSIDYFANDIEDLLDVSFTITTNGTIVHDELIEYLTSPDYHINFAISVDGHAFANMLRVFKNSSINTHDVVMKNIKRLNELGVKPSVHITTHAYNIGYLYDSVKYLHDSYEVNHFGIGTVESVMDIDKKYCDRFIKEMDRISESICNGELDNVTIDLFEWVKPLEDVRSYIRDDSGKVLAESYGRSGNDISHADEKYNIKRCDNTNETTRRIYEIRSEAYKLHQKRLGNQ